MKPFIKYWRSTLRKAQIQKPRRFTTPIERIEQKKRMSEIQLKALFEKESNLFLAEFQKPDCFSSADCHAYVSNVMSSHLDVLFANCIKDYIYLCALNYFSALAGTHNPTNEINKTFVKLPYDEDIWKEVEEDLMEMLMFFYKEKASFKAYVAQMVNEREQSVAQIAEHIKNGWRRMTNYGYQLQIKAKLKGFKLSGRSQYSYVCENADSSCEVCMNLDGQVFDIDDARMGENLPPMHPNCRCSITANPPLSELPDVPDILQGTPIEFLWDMVESAVQRAEGKLDELADNLGDIWSFFFRESIVDTYGTYTTIMIDGVEYRINMASFESVVIMPDGSFLVPELVSEVDKQMLELMEERDSLSVGDLRIEELNTKLREIYELADEADRHVYWKKPYSFYYFGGNVTEKLNEYMRNAASNYADMHDRYWAENLEEFYKLVRNRGEMDLKNQPEWQNSAFVYDGEVVSQDALGNINYGFFGRYCNFPEAVLIAAGGVAQFLAGNSKIENLYVFLDDPRDSYRIMQGIDIYEEENQP